MCIVKSSRSHWFSAEIGRGKGEEREGGGGGVDNSDACIQSVFKLYVRLFFNPGTTD